MLSGFLFPTDNLPLPLWLLSHIVPARFLVSLLRTVLLKGGGVSDVWVELLALLAFGIATLTASSLTFKRRIV